MNSACVQFRGVLRSFVDMSESEPESGSSDALGRALADVSRPPVAKPRPGPRKSTRLSRSWKGKAAAAKKITKVSFEQIEKRLAPYIESQKDRSF